MITKGNEIRLIKPMGVFDNIGEICEVTDVLEDGVISFKFWWLSSWVYVL